VLLFVGNTNKDKGLDLLLKAIHNLLNAGHSVGLVACTENVNRSKETEKEDKYINGLIKKLNLKSNILFLKIIPHIESLYPACDLMVAPFRFTQGPSDYPLPILEAMASSLTVVATPIGGIPEIVKENRTGYLINDITVDSLTNCILSAIRNKKNLRELGLRAQQQVINNFSIEHITDLYIKTYEELIIAQRYSKL
jgi:glycosyltransferase involved in cell wall biosynthesis